LLPQSDRRAIVPLSKDKAEHGLTRNNRKIAKDSAEARREKPMRAHEPAKWQFQKR
jgi:hypothetical protein